MFVGHEFAAFALGVVLARRFGASDATALSVGLVAGASAFLPDLDLLVGGLTYASLLMGQTGLSWEGLWGTSNAIHRGFSHTLVGGGGVAIVVTGVALARRSARAAALPATTVAVGVVSVVLVALGSLASDAGGPSEFVSITFVVVGAIVLGLVVATRTDLGGRAILGGSLVGLLSHPFGDVFMATPPAIRYPLDAAVLTDTITLAADPTLNLLGITFVELLAVWAGLLAYASVTGRSIRGAVHPLASVGLGYPMLMAFVPRPTMVDAHWLGFTIAPFGLVGTIGLVRTRPPKANRGLDALVTGLATVTLAAVSYLLAYLLVFQS